MHAHTVFNWGHAIIQCNFNIKGKWFTSPNERK